jgi:hypothetical protein
VLSGRSGGTISFLEDEEDDARLSPRGAAALKNETEVDAFDRKWPRFNRGRPGKMREF